MSMPKNLVMIRHGESEANVIQRKVKNGEINSFPEEYDQAYDREFRLSELGVEQAKITGEYLKTLYPHGFDVILVSDFTRAKETAALVCLAAGWNDVKIRIDPQLGERNWGHFHKLSQEERAVTFKGKKQDPLHTTMPHGETLLFTRLRARTLLDRSARQYSDKNVLVFSHGEYIECLWAEIGAMRTEKQIEFFHSPEGDIKNCQVVEFRSKKDQDGVNKFSEYRTTNACFKVDGTFKTIEKDLLTPQEILDEVRKYKSITKK